MKNYFVLVFAIFISLSIKTIAQIPNNGFESWENYPDPDNPNNVYQKPDQWLGLLPNSPLTHSFSIEKNMDSYPPGSGEFSMIIKSDTPNGVDGAAFSYDSYPPDLSPEYFPPAFPINYRPLSLSFYYKYLPENGDSMRVACNMYKDGVVIGGVDYNSSQTVSTWTLLEAPISFDTSDLPDSATIILTTFCNTQHNGSRLYVDNLSFDTLATPVNEGVSADLPNCFALAQNHPNPFNPTTIIQYSLPEAANITLKVFDMAGREVSTLVNEEKAAGIYEVNFNAYNLSSGIYFYRIITKEFVKTNKMILLR